MRIGISYQLQELVWRSGSAKLSETCFTHAIFPKQKILSTSFTNSPTSARNSSDAHLEEYSPMPEVGDVRRGSPANLILKLLHVAPQPLLGEHHRVHLLVELVAQDVAGVFAILLVTPQSCLDQLEHGWINRAIWLQNTEECFSHLSYFWTLSWDSICQPR